MSLWIEVSQGKETVKILYDFSRSDQVLFYNAKILGIDFKALNFLGLSHGHTDHYGCLYEILGKTRRECKLFVHPEALKRMIPQRKSGVST